MNTSFASWLAERSAEQIELAPGIATPRSFGDTRREHRATRRAGGLFDFSFMECVEVEGSRALECVDALQTRRLDALPPGRIAYTLLLRDDGSVLNDATVWRLARDCFWVFTGRRADRAWIGQFAATFGIAIPEPTGRAVIAIQGDVSRRTIARSIPGINLTALPYYRFQQMRFADAQCWIARLGYSGETGYEIAIDDEAAPSLWLSLLAQGADAGLVECGFDAADSLRIEAGHILFTRELASSVTPFELGLPRFVDFEGRDFRGALSLRAQRWRHPERRLAGLLPEGTEGKMDADSNVPARIADGTAVMTSACWSPLLERRIGIGFVNGDNAAPGALVKLRGDARARVARLPFYDPARKLPRRAR